MSQDSSVGVWYYECRREQIESYLLKLQSDSVLFPDECEFLLRYKEQLRSSNSVIAPVVYKTITLVAKEHKIEVIVNREQEKLDLITQLPSRVAMLRQISQWNQKHSEPRIAVCVIELDGFSNINDVMGHAAGDLILYDVARRLETFEKYPNKLVRLHGDEFALTLRDMPSVNEIYRVSEWIQAQFEGPFDIHNEEIYLTPSIGLSVSDVVGNDPLDLLESAYIALNHAKTNDLTTENLFKPDQQEKLIKQVALQSDLNQALESDDELEVWYQPKECLLTNKPYGLEALIRWRHPEMGLVSPAEFIPLAERTDLICGITDYVMRHIAQDLPKLKEAGLAGKVSVNISAKDFKRPNIVKEFYDILAKYHATTESVELEITEGAFIADFNHCVLLLEALREVGFALSIDDFGTGYSSLSYLTKLPVDTVKIDMSFVRTIAQSDQARKVYKALIDICDAVGHRVLAEGVDSEEQREILTSIGCDAIQGYLLSKPIPLNETLDYIRSR